MSINVKKGSVIRVFSNGVTYPIPVEDWEKEEAGIDAKPDNAMGNAVGYRFVLEDYNPAGANENVIIDAEINIWEYPNGVIEIKEASDGVNSADVDNAFYAKVD